MKTFEEQLMFSLIDQVLLATSAAADVKPMASERDVLTVITRPMWDLFCKAAGIPPNSSPSEWKGIHTIRVFGSETRVIESSQWWSFSTPIR